MEKKAVIYIRVSDPSQIDNNSLEIQLKYCKLFAKSRGFEIVHEPYADEGKSAKHVNTRPALRELIAFCTTKKNKVDAIIVYKFDRFSRNTSEGLAAISLLAKHGVEVLSATEVAEMNPIGKAIRTILLAISQLDNENKGERVRHNMREVFRKGLWPFKPPVGYKRKYKTKEENKGIAPIQDPNLSHIIANMFKKAATGLYNKSQLARIMNLEGFGDFYKTKANHKIVDRILKKTFYYGYMYAPKWDEYSWGKHEPLTDKNTYDAAFNKIILKNKKHTYHDVALYPLKGLLKCNLCGHPMTTCPARGRNRVVYYYECRNKSCRKLRINKDLAHKYYLQLLKSIQPSQRVIKLFAQMVLNEWDKIINDSKIEAERIAKRISSLKKEMTSIRKTLDKGIYTDIEAKEEAEKIRQEIAILEIERSDVRIEQYDGEIVKEFINHFFMNIDALWEKLDLIKKQSLQHIIFPKGIVLTENKEIRTVELSQSFKLIHELKSQEVLNVTPTGVEPVLPP